MASTINASTSPAAIVQTADGTGILALQTAGTTAVTVDASQNVLIGATSASGFDSGADNLIVGAGSGSTGMTIYSGTAGVGGINFADGNSGSAIYAGGVNYNHSTNQMSFYTTDGTGRMYIDSSGNLLVGTTNAAASAGTGFKFVASTIDVSYVAVCNNSASSTINHYLLYNTNATNNGYRFYVNLNGGIYNYSGNNSNLSDERTKKNIELSNNYLDKICAIPVKTFNYKDEPLGEQKTLGVIAQDVEIVAPELVNNTGFGDTPSDGIPLKSIYTTDLTFALMKAIQEQQALITSLTARITALEGA